MNKLDEYICLLRDAMVMLEEIKRNREMPPWAQMQQQYIALGKQIRAALEAHGDLENK